MVEVINYLRANKASIELALKQYKATEHLDLPIKVPNKLGMNITTTYSELALQKNGKNSKLISDFVKAKAITTEKAKQLKKSQTELCTLLSEFLILSDAKSKNSRKSRSLENLKLKIEQTGFKSADELKLQQKIS